MLLTPVAGVNNNRSTFLQHSWCVVSPVCAQRINRELFINSVQWPVVLVIKKQGRSHGMLAWCTGTRVILTFTTKFANIYRISQEKICLLPNGCTTLIFMLASPLRRAGHTTLQQRWCRAMATRAERRCAAGATVAHGAAA